MGMKAKVTGLSFQGESMHAHDQTMLAKMGFSDRDRKESEHDLACKYLAYEVCDNLWWSLFADELERCRKANDRLVETLSRVPMRGAKACPSCGCASLYRNARLSGRKDYADDTESASEVHLTKGTNQYATTIGFMDVIITGMYFEYIHAEIHKVEEKYIQPVWDAERGERIEGRHEYSCKWENHIEDSFYVGQIDRYPYEVFNSSADVQKSAMIEVKVNPDPISDTIRQIKLYQTYSNFNKYVLATVGTVQPKDLIQLSQESIIHIQLGNAFRDWCKSAPSPESVPKSMEF